MHKLLEIMHLGFLADVSWWERIGPTGIFLFSMVESFFLVPPPETVLFPLALAIPHKALLYGFLVSIGSVVGAVIGYAIGYFGGRPVVIWFTKWRVTRRWFRMEHFESAEVMMQKYGAWAVGIAGFTVVPYKIFTIGGGLTRIPFGMFVIVSLISRSARFMLEAVLIYIYRDAVVDFLKSPVFQGVTLLIFIAFVLSYVFYRKAAKAKAASKAQ